MSFILDSLNKAEHDQQPEEAVPSLKTQYFSPASQQVRAFSPLALVIMGLLFVIALLLAVILFSQKGSKDVIAEVPTPQVTPTSEPQAMTTTAKIPMPQQPAPVSLPEKASVLNDEPNVVPEAKTAPQADPLIASLYEAAQAEPEPIKPSKNAPIVIQPENAPGTLTRERELAIAEAQRLWDESKPQPLPARLSRPTEIKPTVPAAVIAKAEPQPLSGPSIKALSDVPFLHQLPVSVQNQIPTIMYAKHEYEEGAVVLNKKRYTSGDQIVENVVLKEVLADGIVLDMQGKAFKLGAQSSWVNF